MNLEGKVALITGGSRGIGKAIAIALGREGCKIAISYLSNRTAAERTLKEISKYTDVIAISADIGHWLACKKLVDETVTHFGSIDILVNNAGIIISKPITDLKIDEWNQVVAVNLSGAFYCSKAAAEYMIKKRWGRIINISSISGIYGFKNETAYCATKTGLIGLTKSLAKELTQYGILINAVAPSAVETDMLQKLPLEMKKRIITPPIGRFAIAEEIAEVVVFLAKHEYISGETIIIAGGF